MRYLRMKKRWSQHLTGGQVVVIPAADALQYDEPRDKQSVFERVTGESTRTCNTGPDGKTRITGLTAPYLTFPMR
jgi:hypothetical protein